MLTAPDASVSIAGLPREPGNPWSAGPRAAIDWAAACGVRWVQLDAAMPGLRARELSRSDRRDLAAMINRRGLRTGGLDLWIPSDHYTDPAHQDRAIAAVTGALELAADLASISGDRAAAVVSVALGEGAPASTLAAAAERVGATIADHGWPAIESPPAHLATGLDPAAVLGGGGDPVAEAGRLGSKLAAARLSDLSSAGRSAPGEPGGRLDLAAYAATLGVTSGLRTAVVDARQLRAPAEQVPVVVNRWAAAVAPPE